MKILLAGSSRCQRFLPGKLWATLRCSSGVAATSLLINDWPTLRCSSWHDPCYKCDETVPFGLVESRMPPVYRFIDEKTSSSNPRCTKYEHGNALVASSHYFAASWIYQVIHRRVWPRKRTGVQGRTDSQEAVGNPSTRFSRWLPRQSSAMTMPRDRRNPLLSRHKSSGLWFCYRISGHCRCTFRGQLRP